MNILTTENLKKIYETPSGKVYALDGVSVSVSEGEFIAVVGSSGSGKTTFLNMIGGLDRPTAGQVQIRSKPLGSLSSEELTVFRRRNIGFVFQNYNLLPYLNVWENITLPLRLDGVSADEPFIAEIIKSLGLEDKTCNMPYMLSGGQQQRVAIARALVCDPEIILLDEPLGALDLKLRKSMQLELKEIQQKTQKTFIYVTHDQEEALTMSDRVVVMNNGVIEQIGSPEDIYNEPVNAFVADFIGEANILNGIMLDDCRIQILGKELECVDKGFGRNTPVDVVIRPEDIEVTSPEDGQLVGTVENTTFKGVHYEMSVRCGKCEILIHSTKSAEIGSKIGMRVIPFNIQIMNKLLPFYDNVIETTVTYSNQNDNSFEFELEGETVTVPDKYYEEGTKLKITLPPDALSLAGDGVGDLKDLYIESVVYKGEHNEIILESDERKWLMLSDTDEQVATYVPLSFNFSKARFEVISEFSEKEG